ncbi:hypothetical protein DPZ16_34385, partial [Klebsiella pneumoniae]
AGTPRCDYQTDENKNNSLQLLIHADNLTARSGGQEGLTLIIGGSSEGVMVVEVGNITAVKLLPLAESLEYKTGS